MFVAFHANAYFSLGGEVLLYFIERVEVVKIQIWFKIKLVWNLEKIWKNKQPFSFFLSAVGQNLLNGPAWHRISLLCTAHEATRGDSTTRGPVGHWSAQLARRHRPEDDRPTEFILSS
jgi:hypothetical protein